MQFSFQAIKNSAESMLGFGALCLVPVLPLLPYLSYIYARNELKENFADAILISAAVSIVIFKLIFGKKFKYGIYIIMISPAIGYLYSIGGPGPLLALLPIAAGFYFTIKGMFLL